MGWGGRIENKTNNNTRALVSESLANGNLLECVADEKERDREREHSLAIASSTGNHTLPTGRLRAKSVRGGRGRRPPEALP